MKKPIVLLFSMIVLTALLAGCHSEVDPGAVSPLGAIEVQASDNCPHGLNAGTRLSTFSTKYNADNKDRTSNIILASEAIDGTVLKPGEEFSFNETIGSTTRRRGYKKATVYSGGQKTKNYGGGVCQVSSTLFNAADAAGMEIVERHSHSLNVDYIEKGRDATTSHRGKLDLKFANRYGVPVQINVKNSDGTISVEFQVK